MFEEENSEKITVKSLYETKKYLDINHLDDDSEIKIKLYLPPYEVEEVQQGINRMY